MKLFFPSSNMFDLAALWLSKISITNKSLYPQMQSKTEHRAVEAYITTIDALATVLTVLQQIVPYSSKYPANRRLFSICFL